MCKAHLGPLFFLHLIDFCCFQVDDKIMTMTMTLNTLILKMIDILLSSIYSLTRIFGWIKNGVLPDSHLFTHLKIVSSLPNTDPKLLISRSTKLL